MVDRNMFMETLHLVQEIAKTSAEPMDRETALSYFKDMELSQEQQEMIFQFLLQPEESLHSTPHFQMYLNELDGIAELADSQETALYQRLLSGDSSVVEDISRQWLKRVVAIAEEYKGRGVLLDDLVQEGNIGLLLGLNVLSQGGGQADDRKQISAADVPELLRGAVRESMEQYLGEECGEDQQSETILAKVSLVHQAQEYLTQEKGEKPSLRELSEYTRIPVEEINDILSLVKDK